MSDPLYITVLWHMHQPYYKEPERGGYLLPWTYLHAVKDYYDMAALIGKYPKIHCTVNLTSSLLYQLDDYYVKRLKTICRSQEESHRCEKIFGCVVRENRSVD